MSIYSEHFTTGHNQEEVKSDIESLKLMELKNVTQRDLETLKYEVSKHFTDENLTKAIKTLFKTSTGERNENACNEATTPAHDFLTQLSIIRFLGGNYTKIDSDLGGGTKKGICALKNLYNRKVDKTKRIQENGIADSKFFQAVLELLDLDQLNKVKNIAPNQNSRETKKSQKDLNGEQLDNGETITISDLAAQKGTIEQFIPEKQYNILLNYAQTNSKYKRYTQVIVQRDPNQATYIVKSGMPERLSKRALIYPGTKVMKESKVENLDIIKPTEAPQIENNRHIEISESVSMKIERIFSSILKPYGIIKKYFIALVNNFELSAQEITDLALVIYNENRTFDRKKRSRTPIGQLGSAARIDAHKELGLGNKIPAFSRTNWYDQLVGTYGYAKKCGILDATNEESKKIAYAKYNLGPFHRDSQEKMAKALINFKNQALEMKSYAREFAQERGRSTYTYEDILDAEYKYYTVGTDQIV